MDPIFEANGLWYFWDEAWADYIGPYPSREVAEQKMKEYIVKFLGS